MDASTRYAMNARKRERSARIKATHFKPKNPFIENGHPPIEGTDIGTCKLCGHPFSCTSSIQVYGNKHCYKLASRGVLRESLQKSEVKSIASQRDKDGRKLPLHTQRLRAKIF